MVSRRPRRLEEFDYRGCHRYFVTCCVARRRRTFTSDPVIRPLELQILRTCLARDFEVLAYIFMPDHLHLLIAGRRAESDFRCFMTVLRKRLTITFGGHRLWQDGYHERVLRRDEDARRVIEYMLANPVRAGLVDNAMDYPFGWSAQLA